MAVKRIWFPDNPNGAVDQDQRSQVGVGYPSLQTPAPPPFNIITYFRRYLNDLTS